MINSLPVLIFSRQLPVGVAPHWSRCVLLQRNFGPANTRPLQFHVCQQHQLFSTGVKLCGWAQDGTRRMRTCGNGPTTTLSVTTTGCQESQTGKKGLEVKTAWFWNLGLTMNPVTETLASSVRCETVSQATASQSKATLTPIDLLHTSGFHIV